MHGGDPNDEAPDSVPPPPPPPKEPPEIFGIGCIVELQKFFNNDLDGKQAEVMGYNSEGPLDTKNTFRVQFTEPKLLTMDLMEKLKRVK